MGAPVASHPHRCPSRRLALVARPPRQRAGPLSEVRLRPEGPGEGQHLSGMRTWCMKLNWRGLRKVGKWGGLAVAVGSAALWCASQYLYAYLALSRSTWIDFNPGVVGVGLITQSDPPPLQVARCGGFRYADPIDFSSNCWWVSYQASPYMYFEIPLWIPAVFGIAAAGTAWHLDAISQRRVRAGRCPKCGYSLTGVAPSDKCPECGRTA